MVMNLFEIYDYVNIDKVVFHVLATKVAHDMVTGIVYYVRGIDVLRGEG